MVQQRSGHLRRSVICTLFCAAMLVAVACTPTVGPSVPGGDRYVALGSSFAAGPGVPDLIDSNVICGRSSGNYAHIVARERGLNLVDATCQSATTANLFESQGLNPPQLDAVTADTDIVTVTLGGNDIGYAGTSIRCAVLAQAGSGCTVDSGERLATAAGRLSEDLVEGIGAIRSKAPDAEILLVTYLRMFPDEGAECAPSNPIDAASSAQLAEMGRFLDDVFRQVADTTSVTLVDAYANTEHTICADPADRWVEGAAPAPPAIVFHPTAAGMSATADLVMRALDGGAQR